MSEFKPFSVFTTADLEESGLKLKDNLLFNNASDFSYFVEVTASESNKTCTEVILEYCDEKDMDPGDIAKLISSSLKGKLQKEMIDSGLIMEQPSFEGF